MTDTPPGPITGGLALARAIEAQDIDIVFGTVGHGNLAFVDALADAPSLRFVSAFHEQVAMHAADAYYRVSGRVAVVTTTVGPGATNLTTGLGDALLDSSAVVVITGGVPTDYIGREPLQALSVTYDDAQCEIFRPLTKRVIKVQRADDLVPQFNRALQEAVTGSPGPVLLHVPLDLFSSPVSPPAAPVRRVTPVRPRPEPGAVEAAAAVVAGARRPVLYCGGGALSAGAPEAVLELATRHGIPVATSMSGQGVVPESHPLALGTTGVVGTRPGNEALREADVVIAVGTRFPEMDASSWRPEHFASFPPASLVHIDIDPRQLNRTFPATVAVCADACAGVEALTAALDGGDSPDTADWLARLTAVEREWTDSLREVRAGDGVPFEPAYLLTRLRELLPDDAVLVSGVGIRHAVGQHFDVERPRSLVVASGFGTMGQEVAAPIGASLGVPGRPVVGIVGDGAVLACLAAIPTAVAARTDLVWLVLDNGGYASIAVYQAKHYGRHAGTYFTDAKGGSYDVDYVAMARSFGASAHRVDAAASLAPVLEAALAEPGPSVVVLPVTPKPRLLGSGHWDVNDILAAGAAVDRGST